MNRIRHPSEELDWTGERYVPSVHGDIEVEHLHRYTFAHEFVLGKDVLDIACGEGYGSHLLAKMAETVIGVDVSSEAVLHAKAKYVLPNLQFRLGDCTSIPLEDASVDIVVSFETIEHHDQHDAMLTEIKRVLRPDGMLIISTPERDFGGENIHKDNHFHIKELNELEFRALLSSHFKNVMMVGQRLRYGSLISQMDTCATDGGFSFHSGNLASIERYSRDPDPLFLIALASQQEIQSCNLSFFDGTNFILESLKTLRINRDALQSEVDRVKNTVSWRLTKPLRYFWNRFQGMKNIFPKV